MSVHELLDPRNCALVLVDYQPQMAFAVNSIDAQMLINNACGLAKTARVFGIPTIVTTVSEESFSGPMFAGLQSILPEQRPIDRTTMNFWEDENVRRAVEECGRDKLLVGGLWTSVCIALPTLEAVAAGHEVYVVTDACGDVSDVAHDMAIRRMMQAGAVPVTWLQVLLELQRDWASGETAAAVGGIIREHGGTYGVGIQYAAAVRKTRARGAEG